MVLVGFVVGTKEGRVFRIIMAEFQVGAERWSVDCWNLVVVGRVWMMVALAFGH